MRDDCAEIIFRCQPQDRIYCADALGAKAYLRGRFFTADEEGSDTA
jgi:hypothetical protein